MELKERLAIMYNQLKNLPQIKNNLLIFAGVATLGRVRKIDGMRGIAPEPIDLFNHNGNILSSLSLGVATGALVSLAEHRRKTGASAPNIKTKIIGAAMVAGAAANTLVETKYGLNFPLLPPLFANSTPDTIDMAYGMVGAAGGGLAVLSMQPKQT